MIDLKDGQYFQLLIEYPTGVHFFTDDHETDFNNVALINNYKKNPDKVFEIMSQASLLTEKEGIAKPAVADAKPKVKKHYTKRQKYPNGYFYLETHLVLDKDEGFFTHLANARDIVTLNENGQKVIKNEYVLVGADYLEKWSSDLYNEYKDKDRFLNKPVPLKEYPDKK